MKNNVTLASLPTLRRLPKYIHVLKKLSQNDVKYVSATLIAKELGVESIQVRKDLSVTGAVGKPKIGFELEKLITSIGEFLNWNNKQDAFLIGVGPLGKAILGYDNFKNYGLNIIAAFDNDKKIIGKKLNDIEVLPINTLYDLIRTMQIGIAIITTPASVAQEISNNLCKAGIKAIWNFSPVSLKVSGDTIVESVHLSQSLAVLTHKLANKIEK